MNRRASIHSIYLESIPLAVMIDYAASTAPLTVHLDESISDVFTKMNTHKLKVILVVDRETGQFCNFASRLDLIAQIAFSENADWMDEDLRVFLEGEDPQSHVIDTRVWSFPMTTRANALLDPMSKGVHHILVENEQWSDDKSDSDSDSDSNDDLADQPRYILSQWTVIQFLHRNLGRLSAIVDAPIKDIGILNGGGATIRSISMRMGCKEALQLFLKWNCDYLAIIDEQNGGKLIGHVSESDLSGCTAKTIELMRKDPYLQIGHAILAIQKCTSFGLTRKYPVFCTSSDLLKNVMKLIVDTGAYHVAVVDNHRSMRPVSLLSLNEVICKFSPFDFKSNAVSERLARFGHGQTDSKDIQKMIQDQSSDESSGESEIPSESGSTSFDIDAVLNETDSD